MADDSGGNITAPLKAIDFGLMIAFFLPGTVTFFAMKYFSPDISTLFAAVLNKDENLGATFLIVAGSLVVGLITSAFRRAVLDWIHHHTGVEQLDFEYGKFVEKDWQALINEVVNTDYRFYQFYGNMLVALSFLCFARLVHVSVSEHPMSFILNILAIVLLFYSSRLALNDMYANYQGISDNYDKKKP